MDIDYVVISADDSHYLDLYEPVAATWKKLGFKTIMLHITDENSLTETEYGIYRRIKKHYSYPTSWQAQLVRLYAYEMFPEYNLLLSDIDMAPLSKGYFNKNASLISNSQILSYSGQPYSDVPYYPMCYILGAGNVMKDVLELPETFEEFLSQVEQSHTVKWNSDEHYLYDRLKSYSDLVTLPVRKYKLDRIDRGNWVYDPKKVAEEKYIDTHVLRPYKQYKTDIDSLLSYVAHNPPTPSR